MDRDLHIGGNTYKNRLILGTARYPSPTVTSEAINASHCELVTVSLRRESAGRQSGEDFWKLIKETRVHILPNTAGCRSVKEAVTTAHLARELFSTRLLKLEITGDDYTLQPNIFALVEAAAILISDGFEILPYTTEDLVAAEKLLQAGCKVLMPWGAPIGSGQGLTNLPALKTLRARFPETTLIIDAGIGAPSHACQAMELGFDAVLLNTAVARATDPVKMAEAFAGAVHAGRTAFESGLMSRRDFAEPSTPLIGMPFWHSTRDSHA